MAKHTETLTNGLGELFDWFNDHGFNGLLPECSVGTMGNTKDSYGNFKPYDIENGDGVKQHLIMINPYLLKGLTPIEQHVWLVHQMIHYHEYVVKSEIRPDFKLNNNYHDAIFCQKAEDIGIIVRSIDDGDEDRDLYNDETKFTKGHKVTHYIKDRGKFMIAHKMMQKLQPNLLDGISGIELEIPEKKKRNKTTYVCPNCGGSKLYGDGVKDIVCGVCLAKRIDMTQHLDIKLISFNQE